MENVKHVLRIVVYTVISVLAIPVLIMFCAVNAVYALLSRIGCELDRMLGGYHLFYDQDIIRATTLTRIIWTFIGKLGKKDEAN